jgi:hypothetical protein
MAASLGAGQVDIPAIYGFTEAKLAWATCRRPRMKSQADIISTQISGL